MADGPVIRDADLADDGKVVWATIGPTFRRGDTYAIDPRIGRDDALEFWFDHQRVRVAVIDGRVAGTYYLGPNHPGGGSHVANCGYAVHPGSRGRGIGRSIAVDSLDLARAVGFRAMQFNLVASSNAAAVHLWQDLDFRIVGTIPNGFDHPQQGVVDAYVMHRGL